MTDPVDTIIALDPTKAPIGAQDEVREIIESPAHLAWRRFKRHKPGMVGLAVIILLGLMALFAGFIAPYDYENELRDLLWAPPTRLHFSDASGFSWRPFIHPFTMEFDENLNVVRKEDLTRRCYVRFFVKGDPYQLLGVIPARVRLFGVDPITSTSEQPSYSRIYLMGADISGRDIFSRVCYGARISITIGLVGSLFVLIIGLAMGGSMGYFGGRVDDVLYNFSQMVMLLPGFYLLLMLRFMFPSDMNSVSVYFAVILILSLVGWPGFAIVIRGMVKSIRGMDFVQAARAIGLHNGRIIGRHVLPNTLGYVVVATTLRIPGYILGESALSVLGLGIMEPTPSWGNMLNKAMNIVELNQHPWVLWPGVFIFLAVIAFNLVGDGLRDAVDPRLHKA